MRSDFVLQIVNRHTGEIVRGFEPGSHVETDVVEELLTRIHGEGVGLFRTEATVDAVIRKAWGELLHALKSQVRPLKP